MTFNNIIKYVINNLLSEIRSEFKTNLDEAIKPQSEFFSEDTPERYVEAILKSNLLLITHNFSRLHI